jgi:Ctr copper transporter family
MATCSDTIIIGNPGWKEQVMEELELHQTVHLCLSTSTTSKEYPTIPIPIPIPCGNYQIPYLVMTTVDRIASDLLIGLTEPTERVTTQQTIRKTDTTRDTNGRPTLCGSRSWSDTIDQVDSIVTMDMMNTMPVTTRISILMSLEEPHTSIWIILPGHRQLGFLQSERNEATLYLARTFHSATNEPPKVLLCKDMGMKMVMYMRGFHWSTAKQQDLLPCLHFYVGSWGLVDLASFQGAMVFTFLLALLTQGLSAVRAVVVKHVTSKQPKKAFLLLIYVLQSLMGYLIMLIAMMYSWELLLSVVLGVMMGNRLFIKSDKHEMEQ